MLRIIAPKATRGHMEVVLRPRRKDPEAPRSWNLVQAGLVPVFYLALALGLFSSAWKHPFTVWIGVDRDPPLIMWFLSWTPFALSHGLNPLLTDYIFSNTGVNLMWNVSMPLVGLLVAPITVAFGPIFAYNVVETLALAGSAWCAYFLGRRYVSSRLAATVGGLLYGFSPYMVAQSLGHPHVTLAFVPPLILLVLDEIIIRQRYPSAVMGAVLGLLAAAQLLIGEELLAATAIVGLVGLVLLVAMHPASVRLQLPYAAKALLMAGLTFAILAAFPLTVQLLGPHRVGGAIQPPNVFVSDLFNFFVPTRIQQFAPAWATRIYDGFQGNVTEWDAYLGIPLLLLLAYTAVRFWANPVVRLVTCTATVIAVLSLGQTFHVLGRVTHVPVFVAALAFPLLQRYLPGRTMLYLTLFAWLALIRLPLLMDIIPGRLMLFVYLLTGLLLAILWEALFRVRNRSWQLLGVGASLVALLPLLPRLPYPASSAEIPAFFQGRAVTVLPQGDVALLAPFCYELRPDGMVWQASAGMRFRMPEGYAFVPGSTGSTLSPAPSATQKVMLDIERGVAPPRDDTVRRQVKTELQDWRVRTIVVGPMAHRQEMVDFFSSLLHRSPLQVSDVLIWQDIQPAI